jgi:hypothetical protein
MATHALADGPQTELPDGVQDLDALIAEAREEQYEFRLGGRDYMLPSMQDLDVDEVETLAREVQAKVLEGELNDDLAFIQLWKAQIKLGLGEKEYAEFEKNPMTLRVLKTIFTNWQEKSGLDEEEAGEKAGKSRPSTASSKKRRKR